MAKLIFATQEPHGSYHLAPFGKMTHELIHLQPSLDGAASAPAGVKVSSDFDMLDRADAILITGGLTTTFTEAVATRAKKLGTPSAFLELAYPKPFDDPSNISLDLVVATTVGGLELYRRYFPAAGLYALETHPALANLPARAASAHPQVLIGTSVSEELPDHSRELLKLARRLSDGGEFEVLVRLHPREQREIWKDFKVTSGSTLAQDLAAAWAFIAYQTTAFPTSEAMGVPTFYPASEEWMCHLLPAGYADAKPVSEDVLSKMSVLPRAEKPAGSFGAERWNRLLSTLASWPKH